MDENEVGFQIDGSKFKLRICFSLRVRVSVGVSFRAGFTMVKRAWFVIVENLPVVATSMLTGFGNDHSLTFNYKHRIYLVLGSFCETVLAFAFAETVLAFASVASLIFR